MRRASEVGRRRAAAMTAAVLLALLAACSRAPEPPAGPPVTVAAPVAGTVVAVAVKPGDPVSRGTVLVRFDTAPFLAEVRTVEAQLAAATDGRGEAISAAARRLAEARAAATEARKEGQRLMAEAAAGRASKADRDNAIAGARAADIAANGADLALSEARRTLGATGEADARIAVAAAALVGARRELDASTVASPIGGRVAAVRVAAGDVVALGAPLLEIAPDASAAR